MVKQIWCRRWFTER